MAVKRTYTLFDRLCMSLDQAMRAVSGEVVTTGRVYPAEPTQEVELTESQRKHSAALMRVNHAGEVCAQALYHGQELVSRSDHLKAQLQQAATEEGDHLYWCQTRLQELASHTSYLNPVWYAGSFFIGMTAGLIGDKWSLGFVVETERQVIKHLQSHLSLLPTQDERSYKILAQMETDEAKHRDEAIAAGANELPLGIKKGMALVSKVMVKTAYYL